MRVVYRVDALKRTNVDNHLTALDEMDAIERVLTHDANDGPVEDLLSVDSSTVPPFDAPVHSLPPLANKAANHLTGVRYVADYYLRRFLSDADVFVGWSGMCPFTLEAADQLGMETFIVRASPHILESRRAYGEEYEKYGYDNPVGRIDSGVECFEYQLADNVIVSSEYAAKTFQAHGIDAEKVHVVPFECGIGRFDGLQDQSPDDTFTVCTATTVDLARGVHHLLQAWESFADGKDDVHLRVAGNKAERFPQALYDRVEARSDTTFHGYINDVGSLYAESDVFVLPSIADGGPCGPLEAMASGLPVVVSETMGVEMDVESGTSGYVVPRSDPDAIVDRLERLYGSPELQQRMGTAASEHARSARDREAAAFQRVLRSCV